MSLNNRIRLNNIRGFSSFLNKNNEEVDEQHLPPLSLPPQIEPERMPTDVLEPTKAETEPEDDGEEEDSFDHDLWEDQLRQLHKFLWWFIKKSFWVSNAPSTFI